MSVTAVSPQTRNDFIANWPPRVQRTRNAMIADYGLIYWHPFDRLFVGLATYFHRHPQLDEDPHRHIQEDHLRRKVVEGRRTWWRTIGELQKFHPVS